MREFFLELFGTTTGKFEIALFNIWHILFYVIILGSSIGAAFLLKGKTAGTKERVLKILAYVIPALYIADFLIMPLSRSDYSIDVDKLPFHICTLMAFFAPFAQFNKHFKPIKETIVCLTLVASLMYLTYPGAAVGDISPFSYKVLQTFLYHGAMFAWGFLSLATGSVKLRFSTIWKAAIGISLIIVWASLGNAIYSNENHHYDWFFVTGSTFPFVPKGLMPFAVLAAVFGMCAIIHGLYYLFAYKVYKIEKEA